MCGSKGAQCTFHHKQCNSSCTPGNGLHLQCLTMERWCSAGDCIAVLHSLLLSWRSKWREVYHEDGIWSLLELLPGDAESSDWVRGWGESVCLTVLYQLSIPWGIRGHVHVGVAVTDMRLLKLRLWHTRLWQDCHGEHDQLSAKAHTGLHTMCACAV